MKWIVRGSIPTAAILVPAAFFLSVLSPDATALGVLVLGIGLVKRPTQTL
jgi:hypothetical protein